MIKLAIDSQYSLWLRFTLAHYGPTTGSASTQRGSRLTLEGAKALTSLSFDAIELSTAQELTWYPIIGIKTTGEIFRYQGLPDGLGIKLNKKRQILEKRQW